VNVKSWCLILHLKFQFFNQEKESDRCNDNRR